MPRLPRKRPIDYILPFLIMISAGVIVVLGFQLWSALNEANEEKEIYMYLAQGNSRILPWGTGEWERAYNGTRILQGDAVKTQQGSRIVVEFYEDHFVRLDQNSEVVFNEIRDNGGTLDVSLILREGKMWINDNDSSDQPIRFTVRTNHTEINTISTIYEVEQDENELIRVIRGKVEVDIYVDEDGTQNKVDTIQVGVGQEATITESALRKFAQRQSPSVVDALSDTFKESNFYRWNMAEDKNPTDFTVIGGSDAIFDEPATEDASEILEEDEGISGLARPTVTVPSTLTFTTNESTLTIRGTTSAESQKMMVDISAGGTTDTYELNLYISGNTDWSYGVSESSGTLQKGENVYKFYSLDENGDPSSKTTLTVTYGGSEATEEDLDLGALTQPTVDSFNGTEDTAFDVDTVKVVGTVSGAESVTVSGYTLQAFGPGDTTWVYYAKESLGNMDPGENNYTVVATAPDGTTTQTNFTITYNKPAEEETPPEETTPDESATSQSATL